MQLMKKNLLISSIGLISLLCSACEKYKQLNVYKFNYGHMDEDVMPISGWVAPSKMMDCNTLEQYQILKESGLNSIYALYEMYGTSDTTLSGRRFDATEEIYKALDYASQVGVKYFVKDPYLWNLEGEDFKTAFESRHFTDYDSFAGFHYADEPRNHQAFENIKKAYSKFKEYVPSDYAFYVNLNPMEIFTNNGGNLDDYISHLTDYTDTVNPRFLSYDFYAPLGNFPSLKSKYFIQLTAFSEFANERHLPFWAFALSSGHAFSSGSFYRGPTEADIYWQVNTVLAYGAKGLQYFCYQTPAPADRGGSEFYVGQGGSIVNEKGEKTEIFDYVKNVNAYVASIDHLLMNATKIGVMYHEDRPACYMFEEGKESIREASSLVTDDNVIVSAFDYKGKTLYYCVNNSITENATFTLNFKKSHKMNIYPMSLEMRTEKIKAFSDTLEPGKAVLLELL